MQQWSASAARAGGLNLVARLRGGDRVAYLVASAAGLCVLAVTGLLAWQLVAHSALSRQAFRWAFLVTQTWDPAADQYGAAAFIYGTLVTSGIALLVAVPLGVGVSIFLSELAPHRLSSACGLLLELLAAVPVEQREASLALVLVANIAARLLPGARPSIPRRAPSEA